MVPMRAVLALEMRSLGSLDRPSDVGMARVRDAKERKAKRVILAGENMADLVWQKEYCERCKGETKRSESGAELGKERKGLARVFYRQFPEHDYSTMIIHSGMVR